ncbi:Protein O-glucosyltransferase 2 [Linnemannia zychae]|nr:Protein O-glucosyltransferase 2 [Linnemannia zychae]
MRISSAIALVALTTTAMVNGETSTDSNVKVLTSKNFKDTINQPFVLVEFYTPWCGHCKNLEPEYEAAAKLLENHEVIQLAKIDCEAERDICQSYEVNAYPTLKIFREGVAKEYKGTRKSDDIVSYLKKQVAPPVTTLTPETLPEFAESDRVVIVAVLPTNDPQRDEVEKVARFYRDDFVFGVVEEHPDVKAPAVVLYKKFDEGKNIFEGKITDSSLFKFVQANSLPIVDEMGPSNYVQYMDSSIPLAYLFYGNEEQRNQFKDDYEAIAKEWKGKLNFVVIDAQRYGAHAANVGLKKEWPAFAVQDINTAENYPLEQNGEPLTAERIRQQVTRSLEIITKAKIKSEAIPTSNDGPVKILVGHNYDEIVLDKDKDVLIEFYAPWCGHCKNLAPVYDEVGGLYKGSNIIIAKMDATANDLPASVPFKIEGYPTIMFKKAGQNEYVEYRDGRSAAAFVTFLSKNAVNKVEIKDPEGKYVPKLRSDPIPSSQDGPVTIVVGDSYENIVHDNDKDVLIEFYAPWCGHCKNLAPIYDEVGGLYKGSNIVVAKFDATTNDIPASLPFTVDGYPTIKFKKAGAKEYMDYKGARSAAAIVNFLRKHAVNKVEIADPDGLYEPKLRSEAIPTSQDGPVTIVVADSYEKIVHDDDKDVLIEFYAPWCGHCKNLAPVYDEVGGLYKGSNIIVAKMDATFKKAGTKEYIDYGDSRTASALVNFLRKNAVNKVEIADPDGLYEPKLMSEAVPTSQDGPVTIVVADNYEKIVHDNDKDVLIEFYAPWCGHCKNLAPIYDEVGGLYKGSNIVIAKIDATANELPASVPFSIEGYPTIKFKKAGTKEYIDYKGGRSASAFVNFLRKNAVNKVEIADPDGLYEPKLRSEAIPTSQDGPVTIVVADSYEKIVHDNDKDVLIEFYAPWCGHCKKLAPIYDEVGALYKGSNIIVAKMDATVNELPPLVPFSLEGYPTIKFKKAGTKEYIDYKGGRSASAFVNFLRKNAVNKVEIADPDGLYEPKLRSEAIPTSQDGPVTIVVADNYEKIVNDNDKDVLIEFYAPWCGHCKKLAPIYDEVGALYKGSNIVIAKIDATANELPASVPFSIEGYPTIKFKKAGSMEYMDYNGERNAVAFVNFLRKNAVNKVEIEDPEGMYEPQIKSEDIPQSQEGPVTIVVGKNYDEIVLNKDKDVLIEFYAPWCGHCKRLAPTYDELGALYKGSNIVIAKIDATANDLPASVPFRVSGYPTIKFKKAGSTEYMNYSGERKLEAFVSFLEKNAINKVEVGTKSESKKEMRDEL